MIASDDGLDTALARVLHEQGSVDLGSLQRALEEVRRGRSADPGGSLALTLQRQDLVSREALERAFQALGERSGQDHQAALRRLGIPPDLGPYRVARELSRGGMGAIHEIVHETSGVSFALKTILPGIGEEAGEELERFSREAEALGRLNHPHVVRVHGADLEGPVPYLIQDLLPGGTLQERINRGPYLVLDALELIRQLGEGLAHAHERGVLHRDLKPLNVLFDDRDQARLVDFGLARFAGGSSLTRTGQLLGTPAYMAPEQAMGGAVDERCDVYGLAGIAFAVLTGRPPFEGSGLGILAAVVQDPPPAAASLNPKVPAWLSEILARALEKDPDRRYPSVPAFLEAIEQEQAPPARASWRIPLLALVALFAIALVGLGFQHVQRLHAQSLAANELEGHLAPRSGAPRRFSELARELPRLRRLIGEESAAVLLASGLVAVGEDDRERAQEVLGRLRLLPSTKAQVGLLEACADARWSTERRRLASASRRLGVQLNRAEVGFADYRLLKGRADSLTGSPGAALEAFLAAAQPLEPWSDFVRKAAAEAAAEGEFGPDQARALSLALPAHAAEFSSLESWAEAALDPTLDRLGKLLEASGGVPAPFLGSTRSFAQRTLPTARMPDLPPGATHTAEGNYWRQPVLGLQIQTQFPVSAGVFKTLADWLLLAHHLELPETSELLRISRDALRSLGARLDAKQSEQRRRLFDVYLLVKPDSAELGTYALSVSTFYGDQIMRALPSLLRLTARRAPDQQPFWQLWISHLALLRAPPFEWPESARIAYAEVWLDRLRALEPWVRSVTGDPELLAALNRDPAVAVVTGVYSDLAAVLWYGMARGHLEVRDPYASLRAFDAFKPRADLFPNKSWFGDYMIVLSRARHSPATPPAEQPRIRATLQRELRIAIQGALPQHLPHLLTTAWLEREILSHEAYREVLQGCLRLLRDRPDLKTVRVQGAWFAFELGEEEEARRLLREASRYLGGSPERVGDEALAAELLRASAAPLSAELLRRLGNRAERRHLAPRLPKQREPGEGAPPEQQ